MPTNTSTKGGIDYVLGHAPSELQRLMAQSQFWGEQTLEVLVRAGISRGMRVLDLGTGAGDVALLAASLVGETGSVLGIDRAEASVDAATRRAGEMGVMNVRFQAGGKPPLDQASVKAAIAAGEAALNSSGRLLIRKSGTEPLIRVMAEGEDEKLVARVVDDIVAAVEAAAR